MKVSSLIKLDGKLKQIIGADNFDDFGKDDFVTIIGVSNDNSE